MKPARHPLSFDSFVHATPTNVACTLGDEVMILNVEDGVYYGLDAVGSRVWELIQERRTIQAVVEVLQEEFDVDGETCRRDLMNLMRQLVDARLARLADAGPAAG